MIKSLHRMKDRYKTYSGKKIKHPRPILARSRAVPLHASKSMGKNRRPLTKMSYTQKIDLNRSINKSIQSNYLFPFFEFSIIYFKIDSIMKKNRYVLASSTNESKFTVLLRFSIFRLSLKGT